MTNAISTASTVSAIENHVSTFLGDEIVILNLETGLYYGLDSVGSRIWDLIQEPRSIATIRDVLTDEYEIEPEQCQRDLLALVEDMAAEGMVCVTDVPKS